MSVVARQLANPRGVLGWLIGRGMARSNADFSRWTVLQLQQRLDPPPRRIIEVGPGPGIGLEALLGRFPQAQVWGVDRSPEMLRQAGGRNRHAREVGRLILVHGDVSAVRDLAPIDLVAANHVLYFWPKPDEVFTSLRSCLAPGGSLALGYQLRRQMPRLAQRQFPREGFRLYESEAEIEALLAAAGFVDMFHLVKGPTERVEGRLTLASTSR